MGIDLSVQVVDRKLLEQAKAVAAANRAAQVERERLQRIKAQAVQRQQQSRRLLEAPGNDTLAKRRPIGFAPRQPGGMGHAWVATDSIVYGNPLVPYQNAKLYVGSGDGQQWTSARLMDDWDSIQGPPNSLGYFYDTRLQVFTLPAGRQQAVITFIAQSWTGGGETGSPAGLPRTIWSAASPVTFRSFAVGYRSVQVINTPTTMRNRLRALFPDFILKPLYPGDGNIYDENIYWRPGGSTAAYGNDGPGDLWQANEIAKGYGLHARGGTTGVLSDSYSAMIYYSLRESVQTALGALTTSQSRNYAATRSAVGVSALPYLYASFESEDNDYTAGPYEITYGRISEPVSVRDTVTGWTVDTSRTYRPTLPVLWGGSPSGAPLEHWQFWDWDRAGLCQAELQALGYSLGDLVP